MVSRPQARADVRLGAPDVGEPELAEIRDVLESGQLTMGPKVVEFEELLADAVRTTNAVAVSSGTAALHLAVLALGLADVRRAEPYVSAGLRALYHAIVLSRPSSSSTFASKPMSSRAFSTFGIRSSTST